MRGFFVDFSWVKMLAMMFVYFCRKKSTAGWRHGGEQCPNKRGVLTRVPPEKNGQEIHHYESERDENEEIALKSWQDVRPHWKACQPAWAVGSGQSHKLPL